MSFSSDYTVTVKRSHDECFRILSDASNFERFMLFDITASVEVTGNDEVYMDDELNIEEIVPNVEAPEDETRERCARTHFQLKELVQYLGIGKDIPVVGWIAVSKKHKIHVEHRSASDGLVVTDKVRKFIDMSRDTESGDDTSTNAENEDGCDDRAKDGQTKIEEKLTGTTSWYLKYFTEIEARRSHKAFMDRYETFIVENSV